MIGGALASDSDVTTDLIQPFQLDLSNVRGRAVRLGRVLDDVFGLHDYPAQVGQIVAETMIATVLLASLLKYDGVFTLQAKGDGAVSLLVVDVTTAGDVRAYARFDADRLPSADPKSDFRSLLGSGYLAFTVDQGENTEGYQGIVALTGPTLVDCLAHYFEQSEQLLTAARLAARRYPDGWRAGAVLIQHVPEEDEGRIAKSPADLEEDWRRRRRTAGPDARSQQPALSPVPRRACAGLSAQRGSARLPLFGRAGRECAADHPAR